VLTAAAFQRIKLRILRTGDRRTYCNRFNDNPHLTLGEVHAYLHPDIGQRNINCDPARSDFDELVFHDPDGDPMYVRVRITGDRLTYDPRDGDRLAAWFAALDPGAA
jgi:hypothetical protein